MTKIEYYSKYVWYGYEGIGYCDCEYTSENIYDVIKFINHCETRKIRGYKLKDDEGYFEYQSNGKLNSFEKTIYKRTIIEEEVDLKSELRNEKIENVLKTN